MRARGGTRTAFPPLQTLGSHGKSGIRPDTIRSAARNVDNVHTLFGTFQAPPNDRRSPHRGCATFCRKSSGPGFPTAGSEPISSQHMCRLEIPHVGSSSLQTSYGLKRRNWHDRPRRLGWHGRSWRRIRGEGVPAQPTERPLSAFRTSPEETKLRSVDANPCAGTLLIRRIRNLSSIWTGRSCRTDRVRRALIHLMTVTVKLPPRLCEETRH